MSRIALQSGVQNPDNLRDEFALAAPGAFKAWAWRIPFLASLVLVAIGLWVRLKVMETPMFAQVVERKTVSRIPTAEVLRRYPKQVALSALLRMSEQAPFYIYTAFALTYIKDHLHKATGVGLAAVMPLENKTILVDHSSGSQWD